MDKINLYYPTVKNLNLRLVNGDVTGYGAKGSWVHKPSQDSLMQTLPGLTYLSGDQADAPTPLGIAVYGIICGAH